MGTVPTGKMERELRAYFNFWVDQVLRNPTKIDKAMGVFRKHVPEIINRYGGEAARVMSRAGFPTPQEIAVNMAVNDTLQAVQKAIITAQISLGLNARDSARAMIKAGCTASYNNLERVARTETVRAYWDNARAEADEYGLVMVWSAEVSGRTCYRCLAKNGLVVQDRAVYDHANGRCTVIPKEPDSLGVRDKGPDPRFNRRPWNGEVPAFLNSSLGNSLDKSLLSDNHVSRAVRGMVSQGWSSSEAFSFIEAKYPAEVAAMSRQDYSNTLRALEHRAQELWDNLDYVELPETLWHAGHTDLGLMFWTGNRKYANSLYVESLLGLRRVKGEIPRPAKVYEVTPQAGKVLGYRPGGQAAKTQEYVLLGTPHPVAEARRDIVDKYGTPVEVTPSRLGYTVLEPPPVRKKV